MKRTNNTPQIREQLGSGPVRETPALAKKHVVGPKEAQARRDREQNERKRQD